MTADHIQMSDLKKFDLPNLNWWLKDDIGYFQPLPLYALPTNQRSDLFQFSFQKDKNIDQNKSSCHKMFWIFNDMNYYDV